MSGERFTTTRTYSILEVSRRTWEEIYQRFEKAGAEVPLVPRRDGQQHLDMHGIALQVEEEEDKG